MLRTSASKLRCALRVNAAPFRNDLRTLCTARPSWHSHSDEEESNDNPPSPLATSWPVTKVNTWLNLCPEGETMVVERLGSLHQVHRPGWFFSIPFVDRIAYCVNMRERTIFYPPQRAITKDNVSVKVGAVLYVRFVDPIKAAYGSTDPLTAVKELAKSSMRSAVGEMELDQVFHSRNQVNERCCSDVGEAAVNWGMVVTRHEILDVTPDKHISESLDKQAAAERMRREKVLQAEGEKQAASLASQGVKIQLTNESEGHLIRVRNEALAAQTKIQLEAEGKAKAVIMQAEAHAKALKIVAEALADEGGIDAARLSVAKEYIRMYGEIGKNSNTIMMNQKPADVTSLLAQASVALGSVGDLGFGNESKEEERIAAD